MASSNGINANGLKSSEDQEWRKMTSSPPGGAFVTGSPVLRSVVPCLVFLVVYSINDRIRILPRASDVHHVTLYNVSALEVTLFSFSPHRLVSSVQHIALDVFAALPYLLHYLIPVLFPIYLYASRRPEYVPRFFWLLGCSMWAHYFIWYLLPTAPPWVYDSLVHIQSPTGSRSTVTPGSGSGSRSRLSIGDEALDQREGCAFARLDHWSGLPLFHTIFNGNPVPFASFPSGHVSWPICVLLSLPTGTGNRNAVVLYIAWVSWATMYSCHHYLLDIVSAIGVTLLCQRLVNGNNWPLTTYKKLRGSVRCSCPKEVVVQ